MPRNIILQAIQLECSDIVSEYSDRSPLASDDMKGQLSGVAVTIRTLSWMI